MAAKQKHLTGVAAFPFAAPPPATQLPAGPEPADPVDRAWARVAAECPARAGAEAHRHGHLVHVIPMGCPTDVRCFLGEPVPGYSGFWRPLGGHVDLVPKGAASGTKPLYARKSDLYDMAERAGR